MKDRWHIPSDVEWRMQLIARELRRSSTPSEAVLWEAIRHKRLDGRKFRRQVAVGAFVVDFYCASERLIVEVDGRIHEQQRDADTIRQELLESLGLRVLRLTNDEVEQDLPAALAKIRAMLN